MSDFDKTVQDAISNAGVAIPSNNSFGFAGGSIQGLNTDGSSSTLLGSGNTTTSQINTYNANTIIPGTTMSSLKYLSDFSGTATTAASKLTGALATTSMGGGAAGAPSDSVDFRVRLRAQPNTQTKVYGPNDSSNILSILHQTGGMFFPYTPTIAWSQAVEYTATSLIHSNQDYYAYKNTPSTTIDIQGQFSFQNQREGEYMLASMHFLRTVSKMYFGQSNPDLSGLPPPVLLLSGYGNYMFNDLPVIVKSHSYSLDAAVDYVTVTTAGGTARLPSLMNISVSLIVQHTPQDQRKNFDLDQFRTGAMMRGKNKGWI
jgi:hypothetical protein